MILTVARRAPALEPCKNAVEINLALVSCTPNGRFFFKYTVTNNEKSTFSVQIILASLSQPRQPGKPGKPAKPANGYLPAASRCLLMPPDTSRYFHSQDSIARIPPPGFHSQDSTARIPQPGFHSQDSKARIPHPGFQSQDSTARIPQPGCHNQDD